MACLHGYRGNIVDVDLLVRPDDNPRICEVNAFRDKDKTHLCDLISLGLVDASWLPRLVPEHAARLQQLIDDSSG